MSDAEMVLACPECDSAKLQQRNPEHPFSTATHDYYCNDCGASVDEPNRRPRYQDSGLTGLARKLYHADPDEVSG